LRIVLKYIRYSKDRKKLRQIIEEDESYHNVPRETATLINTVTNSNLKISQGRENVDMCEAIKGIYEDGKAEGIAEGEAKGRAETLLEMAKEMLADNTPVETIMKYTKLSLSKIQEIASEM